MDESLLSENADQVVSEASESLQRSSSLLERINAQRQREAQAAAEFGSRIGTGTPPQPTSTNTGWSNDIEMNDNNGLRIPNYSPIANDAVSSSGGGGNVIGGDNSGRFGNPFGSGLATNSFSGFSGFSMNFAPGFDTTTGGNDHDQSSEALLSEQVGSLRHGYSMSAYFKMFVIDIYSLFRSMPVPAQVFTIIFLLWLLWKLI